jgi:sigma-E factor negative regulatory protein RseC
MALVQIDRRQHCNGCTACQTVGENKMQLEAVNRLDARLGDTVEVLIEPRQVIKNSLIVFILPLMMMVAGYFVGVSFSSSHKEGAGILGSLSALAVSFLLIRWFDRRSHQSQKNDAVIVEIIARTTA